MAKQSVHTIAYLFVSLSSACYYVVGPRPPRRPLRKLSARELKPSCCSLVPFPARVFSGVDVDEGTSAGAASWSRADSGRGRDAPSAVVDVGTDA